VRRTAKVSLENYGFRVLLAASGQEAVSIVQRHDSPIALVLLDLTMPEMDGAQTFRELKWLRPELKVILSSGYSERDVSARLAGEDFAGFIQKPYTAAALVQKVTSVAFYNLPDQAPVDLLGQPIAQ
jgi:two-component system cell cycle sensor histidine kinase/response regulator CckA